MVLSILDVSSQIPEELAAKMPQNANGLRIQNRVKLDKNTKPLSTYRNIAYLYNTLPKIVT